MKKLVSLLLACLLLLSALPALAEEGVIDLKYLYSSDSFDPETDITRQLIREELNVNIIPEMYSAADQITLILSSDQTYDMIKVTDTSLLATYAEAHAVTDLTDIVKKYPDFYKGKLKGIELLYKYYYIEKCFRKIDAEMQKIRKAN